MNKCKKCGKNCVGEWCFSHKPRKPLKAKPSEKNKTPLFDFFLSIWNKRQHISEISGEGLGKQPLSIFFHHILPKSKYPEAEFDEDNIILVTFDEHQMVEMDMYKYEEVNKRRQMLIRKYDERAKEGVQE